MFVLIGQTFNDRYAISEQLGEGGAGIIFLVDYLLIHLKGLKNAAARSGRCYNSPHWI